MAKPSKDSVIILNTLLVLLLCSPASLGMSLDMVDPEALVHQLTPTPMDFSGWYDWEAWKPSPELSTAFPYYRMGYDFDGILVEVVDFGKWNFREWPVEKMEEYWKYAEQVIRFLQKEGEANGGQGIVLIIDFDGFQLSHEASTSAIKMALDTFIRLHKLHSVMKYGYLLNANYAAETFINMARPFIGDILENMEIFGTRPEKWKPLLLKKIPADQVPAKYGGTNKDWKPLALAS